MTGRIASMSDAARSLRRNGLAGGGVALAILAIITLFYGSLVLGS